MLLKYVFVLFSQEISGYSLYLAEVLCGLHVTSRKNLPSETEVWKLRIPRTGALFCILDLASHCAVV
jgi:hypothetical protein